MLIALNGYSQSDTVNLHVDVANRLWRDLELCRIERLQLVELRQVKLAQDMKITALENIITTQEHRIDSLDKYIRSKRRKETVLKISVGVGFIGGIILGKL